MQQHEVLFEALELPCGVVLKKQDSEICNVGLLGRRDRSSDV